MTGSNPISINQYFEKTHVYSAPCVFEHCFVVTDYDLCMLASHWSNYGKLRESLLDLQSVMWL